MTITAKRTLYLVPQRNAIRTCRIHYRTTNANNVWMHGSPPNRGRLANTDGTTLLTLVARWIKRGNFAACLSSVRPQWTNRGNAQLTQARHCQSGADPRFEASSRVKHPHVSYQATGKVILQLSEGHIILLMAEASKCESRDPRAMGVRGDFTALPR